MSTIEETYTLINKVAKSYKIKLLLNKISFIFSGVVCIMNLLNFILVITTNYSFKFISLFYLFIILWLLYDTLKSYKDMKKNNRLYKFHHFFAEHYLRYS